MDPSRAFADYPSAMSPAYHALLCGYLLAAGCGEVAYAEFVAEQAELECEIRSTCGVETPGSCSAPAGGDVLDDCHWFLPSHGERCLDAMVATLDAVTDDRAQCGEWDAGNPLEVCDFAEVTRRRRGLACMLSGITMGRPLRDHGIAIVAPILRGTASPRSPTAIARAAARWCEAAQYEHASIAGFHRAAAELTALGAPVDLVRRCHDAAHDERRHAEVALAIASALTGAPLRFGALAPVDDTPRTLRAIAIETLVDGCWGEAAAAVVAQVGASRAEPAIADALTTVAREERRHAELAWATLRWAIDRDASLVEVLLDVVDEQRARRIADDAEPDADDLGHWGLLGVRETAAIELGVLTHVVLPVLRAIVRQGSANHRAATLSTVKPSSFATSSPGALAPK